MPTPRPPPIHRHVLFALALGGGSLAAAALATNADADGRLQRRREAVGRWLGERGVARGLDVGLARERALEVRARAVEVVRRFPESSVAPATHRARAHKLTANAPVRVPPPIF